MHTRNDLDAYVFETDQSHRETPGRTAISAGRPRFQPTWNRRKEILIGTQDKVNPTETALRRTSLIAQKLGEATAYYLWMAERIGGKDRTRFYLSDAAKIIGVSERTLDRFNVKLKTLGFITAVSRKYKGQYTYAEYVLNPINEIIQDDGHRPSNRASQMTPGPSVINDATKRAIKEKKVTHASFPSSSLSSPAGAGDEISGSGPSATASANFVAQGEARDGFDTDESRVSITPLARSVQSWSEQNLPFLLSCGFQSRTSQCLAQDILTYLTDENNGSVDEGKWETFRDAAWPRLRLKLPTTEIQAKVKLGPGWLFKPNKHENEPNFWTILTSARYGGINIPETVLPIGSLVWDMAHLSNEYPSRILDVTRHG